MYGDAFVALLVQELDPSQICPLLSLCPSARVQEVEILMHSKPEDKPNCPLCLFAVTQLEDMIKNHKTEVILETSHSVYCNNNGFVLKTRRRFAMRWINFALTCLKTWPANARTLFIRIRMNWLRCWSLTWVPRRFASTWSCAMTILRNTLNMIRIVCKVRSWFTVRKVCKPVMEIGPVRNLFS